MHIFEFKYCPKCKGNLVKHEEYLRCEGCGEKVFINPTPGASVYPVKNGKVLLSIRGNEPFKGELDSLGGFMVPDESVEKAAVREVQEETGLTVDDLVYLGSYPSVYGDQNSEPTINIYFIANVKEGEEKPKDDVSGLSWIPIEETEKIKSSFSNVKDSLADLREWYKKTRTKL